MSEDKTRSEEARAVLTAAIGALEQEGRHIVARPLIAYRDTHYPPPAPAIVIPDAAIEAAGDGMYLMGWSDRREMLKAAAPHILAANQKKPKAVGWAVVDKNGVIGCRTARDHTRQDAEAWRQSHDRTFAARAPHRVLALVEPSEVDRG